MSQSMRTELGKVRGLGSAHHGIHHWWMQRLTAIALVPLSVWFIISIFQIIPAANAGYDGIAGAAFQYISAPFNAVMAVLLILCLFHHMQLGLQVVIEDYIHHTGIKIASLIIMKFACFALAATCLLAITRILLYRNFYA